MVQAQVTATKELPVLKRGDTGGSVRLLQNILISQGYLNPDLRTGNFLDNTENAVRNFQNDFSLTSDGIVGAKTWDVLGNVLWS
jgi:peptidoglycan hydrolase-like protein with peptidoglycan-binding domain